MDKLNIYELLSWVIPGVLLTCIIAILFPAIVAPIAAIKLPDAYGVIALMAAAVFVGNLVQAIASLVEPLLYKSWGGRSSLPVR